MSFIEWAKKELDLLNKDKDGMQALMNRNLLEILKVFDKQGHSGFSASYLRRALHRLLDWKPLTPLTGEDDEWSVCSSINGKITEQNIRCSAVFRYNRDNSTAHYIDGKVYSDNGGITWFTKGGGCSSIPVTFPFTVPSEPEKVYIEYTEEVPAGYSSDKYEIITDKPERIKALYERKRKEFDEVEWEEGD